MNILQVVHSFPPYTMAGTEVYTYNLSKALAKRHRVSVLHRINNRTLKEYELIHNGLEGMDVYSINNTLRHCHSFKMTYRNDFIAQRVGILLDTIRPDIVHIQHLLFLSTSIIDEIKKRGIPVVFTLNDYWLLCHQGQLLNRRLEICEGPDGARCIDCLYYLLGLKKNIMRIYQAISQKTPPSLIKALKTLYISYAKETFLTYNNMHNMVSSRIAHIKNMLKGVDLFLSPSNFLRQKFLQAGLPETKILTCRYGFDLGSIINTKTSNSNGRLRFAFMGTFLPSKGVDVLIKAFDKLKGRNNVELKLYGDLKVYKGYEHYLNYIRKLSRGKNIRFIGRYENKSLKEILSEIDIVVVPSIWNENSPLIIQEVFSAKVPVVASRVGGIPELVEDDVNGLLFTPGDSEDLHKKLMRFLDEPDLLGRLKNNIKPPKDIKTNAGEIEKLYVGLLNEEGRDSEA